MERKKFLCVNLTFTHREKTTLNAQAATGGAPTTSLLISG